MHSNGSGYLSLQSTLHHDRSFLSPFLFQFVFIAPMIFFSVCFFSLDNLLFFQVWHEGGKSG